MIEFSWLEITFQIISLLYALSILIEISVKKREKTKLVEKN